MNASKTLPMSSKYIFLTNIPTPYRNSFYNDLFQAGLDFEVLYMRITEDGRSWTIPNSAMHHPCIIDSGTYMMIGNYHLHINIKLILRMVRSKESIFIMGGAWNDFNVVLICILARLGFIDNVMYFWSEANYLTNGARRKSILKNFVRKFVYHSSACFQISSGIMTKKTFDKWGVCVKKYIDLPNTIEEDKFTLDISHINNREIAVKPVFFMPVRLIESIKGILNFFNSIGLENVKKSLFLIAGEGPDHQLIFDYIHKNNLSKNIVMLGHCDSEAICNYYRSANVFVLPSFSDASPLVVIEALSMHLPLLISNRCGNHFESVRVGKNGYTFDPSSPEEIKIAYEAILKRKSDWRIMGEVSFSIFDTIFKKRVVINNFIKQLQSS